MFKEVELKNFDFNVFNKIGQDWMLITAKSGEMVNSMTASWGGFGVLFNEDVCFIFIRPQRFTKTLVDKEDRFSLNFFDVKSDEKMRKILQYMGTASGKNEDKILTSGLTIENDFDAPYFKEAKTVFICKKLYRQGMNEDGFMDNGIVEKWYQAKDFHDMYIAKIEKVLIK